MMRLGIFCLGVGAFALVAGCGQKGALYLPPKSGTVVTRPAPATAPSTPAPQSEGQPAPEQAAPGTTPAPPKDKNKDNDSQPPQ
jgi:predicted small lipoprotein YifL